jgi:acetyl esterase/lipase
MKKWIARACCVVLLAVGSGRAFAEEPKAAAGGGTRGEPIALWPDGKVPAVQGEKEATGEEKDMSRPEQKGVIRLGNVNKPTITVFKPAADKDTGAAVVVCPGGGYNILAWDLEGSEVCEWLNSVGVSGVLLKYRVPGRRGGALQDVQRAIGLVRQHADDWKIDPKRVGVMGFSAGGHLSAAVCNNFKERAYAPVDDADKQSCRPDFAMLIYPAYLATKEDMTKMAPDLKVTPETPPTFIVMTQDDPVNDQNVFTYMLALKQNRVHAEAHIYPTGGHGYGLRPSPNGVSHWPQRAAEWMQTMGFLKKG